MNFFIIFLLAIFGAIILLIIPVFLLKNKVKAMALTGTVLFSIAFILLIKTALEGYKDEGWSVMYIAPLAIAGVVYLIRATTISNIEKNNKSLIILLLVALPIPASILITEMIAK